MGLSINTRQGEIRSGITDFKHACIRRDKIRGHSSYAGRDQNQGNKDKFKGIHGETNVKEIQAD